jgi:hypothetical protein
MRAGGGRAALIRFVIKAEDTYARGRWTEGQEEGVLEDVGAIAHPETSRGLGPPHSLCKCRVSFGS